MCRRAAAEISRYEMQKWQWPDGNGIDTRSQFENRKPTIAFIHVQMCSFFRKTVKEVFFLCNFLFNWNFDEDSPETAKENFLGVNFSQSRGKFRFVGKFGNNQHWWCLTIQPAIVRPIYAERGTISKSWQGHNKTQGNIHSQLQSQEFIRLEENTYFSVKRTYFFFKTWYNFPLVLAYQKMTSSCVDIIDF